MKNLIKYLFTSMLSLSSFFTSELDQSKKRDREVENIFPERPKKKTKNINSNEEIEKKTIEDLKKYFNDPKISEKIRTSKPINTKYMEIDINEYSGITIVGTIEKSNGLLNRIENISLNFSRFPISILRYYQIEYILKSMRNIKELNISNTGTTTYSFFNLMNLIPEKSKLEKIICKGNNLFPVHNNIINIPIINSFFPNLNSVDMEGCLIHPLIILHFLNKCKKLKSLNIMNCNMSYFTLPTSILISKRLTNLEEITLGKNGTKNIQLIFSSCNKLKKINGVSGKQVEEILLESQQEVEKIRNKNYESFKSIPQEVFAQIMEFMGKKSFVIKILNKYYANYYHKVQKEENNKKFVANFNSKYHKIPKDGFLMGNEIKVVNSFYEEVKTPENNKLIKESMIVFIKNFFKFYSLNKEKFNMINLIIGPPKKDHGDIRFSMDIIKNISNVSKNKSGPEVNKLIIKNLYIAPKTFAEILKKFKSINELYISNIKLNKFEEKMLDNCKPQTKTIKKLFFSKKELINVNSRIKLIILIKSINKEIEIINVDEDDDIKKQFDDTIFIK